MLSKDEFNEKVEKSTLELKEYASNFMKKGESIHHNAPQYEEVERRMLDDENWPELFSNMESQIIEDEILYNLSKDQNVLNFYYLHFPEANEIKKKIIEVCLRKNDEKCCMEIANRIINILDEEVENNSEEYKQVSSWDLSDWINSSKQLIMEIIDEIGAQQRYNSDVITDDMKEITKKMVYRIYDHFPADIQAELHNGYLYKVNPTEENTEEYLDRLKEDINFYGSVSEEVIERGTPKYDELLRIENEIKACFKRLATMNKWDFVFEIIQELLEIEMDIYWERDWMSIMLKAYEFDERFIELYRSHKDFFADWINGGKEREILRLLEIVVKYGTKEEYKELEKIIVKKRGRIKGLKKVYMSNKPDNVPPKRFTIEELKPVLTELGNNKLYFPLNWNLKKEQEELFDEGKLDKKDLEELNISFFLQTCIGNEVVIPIIKDEKMLKEDLFEYDLVEETTFPLICHTLRVRDGRNRFNYQFCFLSEGETFVIEDRQLKILDYPNGDQWKNVACTEQEKGNPVYRKGKKVFEI